MRGNTSVWIATAVGVLLLVAMAVAGWSTFCTRPGHSPGMQCQSNLRHIAQLGGLYADGGNEFFPFSEDGSLASLQILLDSHDDVDPYLFVCLADNVTVAANPGPDGRYRLARKTCSYDYAPVRLSPDDDAPLAWCREPVHEGGRAVVSTKCSVRYMIEAEFQKELEKLEAFRSR